MKPIEFKSDTVKISGPKVDNSYHITFVVGEYEVEKVKNLIGIFDTVLKVRVEIDE